MKRVLLIFFVLITVSVCKAQNHSDSVWTEKYQQKLSVLIDSSYKPRIRDENKRAGFVVYMVAHLKSELPNGVESVLADSLSIIKSRIAQDYAYLLYRQKTANQEAQYYTWNDEIIQKMKLGFLKAWPKDDLVMGNKVCDCVVTKLRKEFPDGISLPVAKDPMIKIVNQCRNELVPANKKQ